jgi:RimJ/RimL family protein N-acetyltransferase
MKYLLTGEETERLKFRLLQESDYDEWIKLFEGTDVARFLGMAHLNSAKEQCDMWFQKGFERYKNMNGGMNVLVNKETGKIVGQCGLLVQEVGDDTIMEVGYSVLPQYWGKGYAIEAASKCRNHAFENRYVDELYSIIHIENNSSMRVAEKNGMRVHRSIPEFKGMPVHLYRITREEWQQRTS